MHQALLIALEGLDGAGTTTQLHLLGKLLAEQGIDVQVTAEPSAGPCGRLLRRALTAEESLTEEVLALLFAADRLDHLEKEIKPALAAGKLVLTDRYLLSSLVYQTTALPLSWVRTINSYARAPDLTLFLQVSLETALGRRRGRAQRPEYFEEQERQRRIKDTYERLLSESAELQLGPWALIDGELPPEVITEQLWQILKNYLASASAALADLRAPKRYK